LVQTDQLGIVAKAAAGTVDRLELTLENRFLKKLNAVLKELDRTNGAKR